MLLPQLRNKTDGPSAEERLAVVEKDLAECTELRRLMEETLTAAYASGIQMEIDTLKSDLAGLMRNQEGLERDRAALQKVLDRQALERKAKELSLAASRKGDLEAQLRKAGVAIEAAAADLEKAWEAYEVLFQEAEVFNAGLPQLNSGNATQRPLRGISAPAALGLPVEVLPFLKVAAGTVKRIAAIRIHATKPKPPQIRPHRGQKVIFSTSVSGGGQGIF